MPLPPATPRTPGRVSTHWTVGNQQFTAGTDVLPTSTSPNIGTASTTPRTITPLATDAQSGSATVGALGAGASSTLTIPIQFTNLPTGIVGGPADLLQFQITVNSISHAVAGLVIASFTLTPKAFTANGIFAKEVLQNGIVYTGWGASAVVTVTAVSATASGPLTVRAVAWLYDTLG